MKWVAVLTIAWLAQPALAGGKAKEVAEFVVKRFGRIAVKEGVAEFAGRIEMMAARHGPEVYEAARKVGPTALHILDHAGPHAKTAAQLLARFGDDAVFLAARPQTLSLVGKHGDQAVRVLVKHKGIAEPIIEKFGDRGIQALAPLSQQNGRRLAMLLDDAAILKPGKADELLQIIGSYGDRAMNFVWDHKGTLAVTAVLATFVAHPGDYITGARDLAKVAGENIARPVAEIPSKVAVEVVRGTNCTFVFVGSLLLVALLIGVRIWRRRKRSVRASAL